MSLQLKPIVLELFKDLWEIKLHLYQFNVCLSLTGCLPCHFLSLSVGKFQKPPSMPAQRLCGTFTHWNYLASYDLSAGLPYSVASQGCTIYLALNFKLVSPLVPSCEWLLPACLLYLFDLSSYILPLQYVLYEKRTPHLAWYEFAPSSESEHRGQSIEKLAVMQSR